MITGAVNTKQTRAYLGSAQIQTVEPMFSLGFGKRGDQGSAVRVVVFSRVRTRNLSRDCMKVATQFGLCVA